MRLVGKPLEVYQYLEPLYNDYRRVRLHQEDGTYALSHVDEVVDDMLRKDFLFDIALPRVPARCAASYTSVGIGLTWYQGPDVSRLAWTRLRLGVWDGLFRFRAGVMTCNRYQASAQAGGPRRARIHHLGTTSVSDRSV